MHARTRFAGLIDQLTEGITTLTTSERWQRYLDVQSRFHRYSVNNVLLIGAQRPDATRVAGFNAWRRLDRTVRKGEKAIWILAPMVYKTDESEAEERRSVRGFKFVPVFDVMQTDGPELPSICHRLEGDDGSEHYNGLVAVAQSIGFTVEDHEFTGSTNGDCSHAERRIRVEPRNAPAQRVKTLAHEIAHSVLHEHFDRRAVAELEAESTAYVVCRALGIDSAGYSFGYVTAWAGGGEEAITEIRGSCGRIQKTAATILAALELPVEQAA